MSARAFKPLENRRPATPPELENHAPMSEVGEAAVDEEGIWMARCRNSRTDHIEIDPPDDDGEIMIAIRNLRHDIGGVEEVDWSHVYLDRAQMRSLFVWLGKHVHKG